MTINVMWLFMREHKAAHSCQWNKLSKVHITCKYSLCESTVVKKLECLLYSAGALDSMLKKDRQQALGTLCMVCLVVCLVENIVLFTFWDKFPTVFYSDNTIDDTGGNEGYIIRGYIWADSNVIDIALQLEKSLCINNCREITEKFQVHVLY